MSRLDILRANEVYHDREAATYDAGMPYIKNSFAQAMFDEDIRRIIASAGIDSEGTLSVLDCGAGTGNLTLKFLESGCAVTAVDVSSEMLARLRQKAALLSRGKLNTVHSDIDSFLDGCGSTYDIVCSSSFLHHLPDYIATYDRMAATCGQVMYTAFEPSARQQWGTAQKMLSNMDVGLHEFFARRFWNPVVVGRGALRRLGLMRQVSDQDHYTPEPSLVERPDLGVNPDVLGDVLRRNGFTEVRPQWRSVKRFRITYCIDKYLVHSRNALFLIGRRAG